MMIHPYSVRRRSLLLGFVALPFAARRATAAGVRYQPLFHIARSKNANIVQYDAVLGAREGGLDERSPVVGYWIMKAENGRREGLTMLERRAYGFRVTAERGSSSWLLNLNALPARTVRVLWWNGRWVPQVGIRGRSAILERIYVAADDSGFIPSVRWIDLFGIDMATGAPVVERIVP